MLVAIEGIDRAGKTTQVARLSKHIAVASGRAVRTLSFPSCNTPTGKVIAEHLRDGGCSPHTMQFLNIANRYEFATEIDDLNRRGVVVICDRYILSGLAYAYAFGLSVEFFRAIQEKLPQPTLTVVIDMPADRAMKRERESAGFLREESKCAGGGSRDVQS